MPVFTEPSSSDTCNRSRLSSDRDTTVAGCGNTYSETRTWHAVDACNNTSAQVHQTIMVVDTTNPTITQADDGTVDCQAMPVLTYPSSSYTCNSSSVVLDSDTSTAGCGNTYSRSEERRVGEECNNTSAQVHQTIMVVDITNPTITQPADGTVECQAMPVFTETSSSDKWNRS